jgi:hypothetical protein
MNIVVQVEVEEAIDIKVGAIAVEVVKNIKEIIITIKMREI